MTPNIEQALRQLISTCYQENSKSTGIDYLLSVTQPYGKQKSFQQLCTITGMTQDAVKEVIRDELVKIAQDYMRMGQCMRDRYDSDEAYFYGEDYA